MTDHELGILGKYTIALGWYAAFNYIVGIVETVLAYIYLPTWVFWLVLVLNVLTTLGFGHKIEKLRTKFESKFNI